MKPRGILVVALVLATLSTACGADPAPPPVASGPSGSLGVFTQADADQTLAALCRMIGLGRSELDPANGTFYDLLHEKLHVLAAATEPVDRALVAGLLQAKARVEADLRTGDRLPFEYTGDVEALLATATAALEAVGLKATGC